MTKELKAGQVVIQTKGRDAGKVGVVRWVIGDRVRVEWSTDRRYLPSIRQGRDGDLSWALLRKGHRSSGTSKPSTLRAYGLKVVDPRHLARLKEGVDAAKVAYDNARTLGAFPSAAWDAWVEAADEAADLLVEWAEDVILPGEAREDVEPEGTPEPEGFHDSLRPALNDDEGLEKYRRETAAMAHQAKKEDPKAAILRSGRERRAREAKKGLTPADREAIEALSLNVGEVALENYPDLRVVYRRTGVRGASRLMDLPTVNYYWLMEGRRTLLETVSVRSLDTYLRGLCSTCGRYLVEDPTMGPSCPDVGLAHS